MTNFGKKNPSAWKEMQRSNGIKGFFQLQDLEVGLVLLLFW